MPIMCSVVGCDRFAVCKGMCMRCYGRLAKPPKTQRKSNRESLLAKYPNEWKILNAMRQRCNNPKSSEYKRYGGRGIRVCDRWMGKDGLKNFIDDMGRRPEGVTKNGHAKYSIDRIDNDGDYCPENCRWTTWWEQNSKTSRNNDTVGVYQIGPHRWRAELTIDGDTHRGSFSTEEEAIDYRSELEMRYLTKQE